VCLLFERRPLTCCWKCTRLRTRRYFRTMACCVQRTDRKSNIAPAHIAYERGKPAKFQCHIYAKQSSRKSYAKLHSITALMHGTTIVVVQSRNREIQTYNTPLPSPFPSVARGPRFENTWIRGFITIENT